MHNAGMSAFLEDLNERQKEAVLHRGGPLLIVAGAGTGKTMVLIRRYQSFLDVEQCSTDRLLALTFTEKAAMEMEDRVVKLLPTGAYDFWISTFHGFCRRVLEAHGLEIGLSNEFRLLTTTDAWMLLCRHERDLPLDYYRPLGHPTRFFRALLQHISRAKDEGVTAETYQAFVRDLVLDGDEEIVRGEKKRLQELADLYSAYRKILLKEGCLDFGDLILETLRLFHERPEILQTYREQFLSCMIDEFQDTNWAQYELVKLLIEPRRELAVVGDDDQAIYKFRGASLANILQFREDFPEAKTIALTRNYRSRAEILQSAYRVIVKNDPHRLEGQLLDIGISKKLEAHRETGGKVEIWWEATLEQEAQKLPRSIQEQKRADATLRWNDFAILVRSNDSSAPFIMALEQAGIPYQFVALRGLYQKPPVLDALALLRLLVTPEDSLVVWRALTLPCYPFAAADLAAWSHYARRKGCSLWRALQDASHGIMNSGVSIEAVAVAQRLMHDVDAWAELARRTRPLYVLQTVLDRSGYLKSLMSLPEREKRDALQHLNAFAERIKHYETTVLDPCLAEFLEEFRLEVESGEEGALEFDPDLGPEAVNVMTIHAAKGLEFRVVYVVSLVDQRFPTRERGDVIPLPDGLVPERLVGSEVHVEEERRLFYVAMTRAKDALFLTGASRYGGVREKKPSLFLADLGWELPLAQIRHAEAPDLFLRQEINQEEREPLELFGLKRRFSFTQLAAFRRCPLQYKFAHVYRLPVFGSAQKSFGQSLHVTFQRILEQHLERVRATQACLFDALSRDEPKIMGAFSVNDDEAIEIFQASWIDEWYKDRREQETMFQTGRQAVKAFCEGCRAHVPDVLELEKAFVLVLGEHSMRGKIDRVDRLPNGHVVIFDYKTGHKRAVLELEDKEQLHLYQLAMEHRGYVVDRLVYLYVIDQEVANVEPLVQGNREEFIERITVRMDELLRSNFFPRPDAVSCRHCDFRSICEFRKM